MIPTSARLDAIGRDIERLTLDPGSISAPLTRLVRPLLFRFNWRPKHDVEAIRALVVQLDWLQQRGGDPRECTRLFEGAIDELADNVKRTERATVVSGRPQIAHAAWLRRLFELLVHAERAVANAKDRTALALAAAVDHARVLPPLSMGKQVPGSGAAPAQDDVDAARAEGTPDTAAAPETPPEPIADPVRVLELQLDTIDHLMGAAREERSILGRRRRLLDAARQLLLEASAALVLDQDGVHRRLESIAQQITLLNRYQAVGLSPDVALLHQARTALSRGQRDKVYAALSVLRDGAVTSGDVRFTELTAAALDQLAGGPLTTANAEASAARSAQEVLGQRVVEAIHNGYQQRRRAGPQIENRWLAEAVREYYAPGRERAALAHALAVDGCFDVGGVLSPVRIEEHYIRQRLVRFPTQRQELVPAQSPADIVTAVIRDPRLVVLDLAAGRLLARRYVQDEVAKRTKTKMRGEVRVYLLDGSSSMLGPRARMRDSIMVAELATLIRRLEKPDKHTRVVLYYRYFNAEPGPVSRVETPGGAIEAIRDVTSTPRSGGTNIEWALISSLELIHKATQTDPELAQAQIVLVSDGNAPVDEAVISRARDRIGDFPVGVSVIALGLENQALRGLVARQRARSERAFYHFLPDHFLKRVSDGQLGGTTGVHLPPVPRSPLEERALDESMNALLEDLSDLQRSRETEALRSLDRLDRDNRIQQEDLRAKGEGERARIEALYRDDRSLQRRYDRWFPPAPEGVAPTPFALARLGPAEGTIERDDLESMLVVLSTIAEVVQTVGSDRLGRRADAVDLLDRLLPHTRLSPARYHELIRSYPDELDAAVRAVHGSVHSSLGWDL